MGLRSEGLTWQTSIAFYVTPQASPAGPVVVSLRDGGYVSLHFFRLLLRIRFDWEHELEERVGAGKLSVDDKGVGYPWGNT